MADCRLGNQSITSCFECKGHCSAIPSLITRKTDRSLVDGVTCNLAIAQIFFVYMISNITTLASQYDSGSNLAGVEIRMHCHLRGLAYQKYSVTFTDDTSAASVAVTNAAIATALISGTSDPNKLTQLQSGSAAIANITLGSNSNVTLANVTALRESLMNILATVDTTNSKNSSNNSEHVSILTNAI
jgi:hypothetical protein